jgi:hypothetical protein
MLVPRRCWAAWVAYLLLLPSCVVRISAATGQAPSASRGCTESRWEGTIDRDLELFAKTTIHPQLLDVGRSQCRGGWTVLIVDNELFAMPFGELPSTKRPIVMDLLAKALCHRKFPNVEFVLNAYERRRATQASQAAVVFSASKDPGRDMDIVFPHRSLSFLHSIRQHLAGDLQFEQREDRAVWRGTASGGAYSKHTWRHSTRSRAVASCLEKPELCDAGAALASPGGRPGCGLGPWQRQPPACPRQHQVGQVRRSPSEATPPRRLPVQASPATTPSRCPPKPGSR